MSYNSYVIDMLTVFTGQAIYNSDGKRIHGWSSRYRKAVILEYVTHEDEDELLQHEPSHQFYAPHCSNWCVMNVEAIFNLFNDVDCWCSGCQTAIQANADRFWRDSYTLTISSMAGGTTSPSRGTYEYTEGASVTVKAIAIDGWEFKSWYLDQHEERRKVYYDNPVTVEMYDDHELTAYFNYLGGGGGAEVCPTLLAWDGSDYIDLRVIDIHADGDVVREASVATDLVSIDNHKAEFRLREGWEGLTYSHSEIDQVKLHAVDSDGNWRLCPLVEATHSEFGNVLPRLLLSDDKRIDLYLLETTDLEFAVPQTDEIQDFVFVIEGCNMLKY